MTLLSVGMESLQANQGLYFILHDAEKKICLKMTSSPEIFTVGSAEARNSEGFLNSVRESSMD